MHTIRAAIFVMALLLFGGTAKAMMVFDPENYAENLISALEAIEQTQKMIEQLKTQIQQYERMVKDALSLPDFITGDLANEISQLADFRSEIENLMNNALDGFGGGIESILGNFYKPSDLKANPGLFAKRDSLGTVGQSEMLGYELAKGYADGTMKAIDRQAEDVEEFNDRFVKILNSGQGAEGQMQVMQAQLEMLSLIVERLGEIRELVIYGAGVQAAQTEALVQKEARQRVIQAVVSGDSEYFQGELAPPPASYKYFDE